MKGYKTLAFNGIMAIVAIMHALNNDAQLPDAAAVQGVVDNFSTWFEGALVVGNIILRAITTTPVLKKE
jgi:hypothetical protein